MHTTLYVTSYSSENHYVLLYDSIHSYKVFVLDIAKCPSNSLKSSEKVNRYIYIYIYIYTLAISK